VIMLIHLTALAVDISVVRHQLAVFRFVDIHCV
jgi:hypothetical protein